jgi:hypothetical protein
MTGWLKLTDDQRRTSLAQAGIKSGIIPKALEKDWWVTLTLKALFQTPYADSLIFKGGTTLSKCWKLINRFSEDIDIAMSPSLFNMTYEATPGSSYLSRLKRNGCLFTTHELSKALLEQFEALGVPAKMITIEAGEIPLDRRDKDPQELFIKYPSLYAPNPYLADEVKIEVSVRSKLEPYTSVPIRSLLDEYFPNKAYAEEPFKVLAVEPRKTFLEKAFLLHEQFHRGETTIIKTERMSRHFHDLSMMMDTSVYEEALADKELYAAIIEHRRYYNKMRGIDYDLLNTPYINFFPPDDMVEGYKADYQAMLDNMIYGNAPDKDQLFLKIAALVQKFRNA